MPSHNSFEHSCLLELVFCGQIALVHDSPLAAHWLRIVELHCEDARLATTHALEFERLARHFQRRRDDRRTQTDA